jgi:hypothetical protein
VTSTFTLFGRDADEGADSGPVVVSVPHAGLVVPADSRCPRE